MSARARSFCAFVAWLGVKLTPGQRALARVAFDGANPCDLKGAERNMARQIFGDVDTIPPEAREILACVAGGRGGKTYVLLALRCLHLALTCDLSSLAPGELGFGIIVAPDIRLARQALRFAAGAVRRSPELAALIVKDGTDELVLSRPDGQQVQIEVLPATRGGSSVRSRSYFFVGLDEGNFFYSDDGYTVTDDEIFRATSPRILPGGQLCMVSTPWLESGVLFEHFVRNHPNPSCAVDGDVAPGAPTDAIAAWAPTLTLNSSEKNVRAVAREQARDPVNAEREFGARFVARGAGRFLDAVAIKLNTFDRPARLAPPAENQPKFAVAAALDPGFTSDACSLVVVRRELGRARVAEIAERRPEKGKPLKPSEAIGELCAIAAAHGVRVIWTDVHYVESVREHAATAGLSVDTVPGGNAGKVLTHAKVRDELNSERCDIARDHEVLLSQLRTIVSKPMPGGGISITSPRRKGRHGDVASAWVLATWALSEQPEGTALAAQCGNGGSRWAGMPGRGFG